MGYWFGQNKLKKTLDLCYNDGPLALIIFDNSYARIVDPISSKILNELALWKRLKLPEKTIESVEWLNEFKSVDTRRPSETDCQDFNTIKTRIESWFKSSSPESISIKDIASLSAPQWMIHQLITGGLSMNDATHSASVIMTKIRLTFVENWQSRQKVQTEHTVFPTPLYDISPIRISTMWGKGTPGSINAKNIANQNTGTFK